MNSVENWEKKFNNLPHLPRTQPHLGCVGALKLIFDSIKRHDNLDKVINIEGSETTHTLGHYVEILSRYNIIEVDRENGYYNIRKCLDDYDEEDFEYRLAKFFYTNIKYISEMLSFLDEPKTTREILQNANTEYNMTWKTNYEIHSRIKWLTDLGLINSMSYKKLYVISEEGKKFIGLNKPMEPIVLSEFIYDYTQNEQEINLPKWIPTIDWYSDVQNKRNTLGYIPGRSEKAISQILRLLEFTLNIEDIEAIKKHINKITKCKDSSLNSFLTFLTNIEVLDRIGEKVYKTSEYGVKLLECDLPEVCLLFLMNKNYKFIFEILLILDESPHEPKEIAARGVTEFDMNSENLDRIHERIRHLKSVQLILNDKGKSLKLSKRGELLCEFLKSKMPLNMTEHEHAPKKNNESYEVDNYKILLKETRLASTDSANPHKFEELLEKIFIELGFETQLLAQAGTTDILLNAPTAPKYAYKVAVEVKTNREGKIKENTVNFDALKEHKEKHGADFSVIIGKSFHGERLKKFAKNNDVLLMDLDIIDTLIKRHKVYPL